MVKAKSLRGLSNLLLDENINPDYFYTKYGLMLSIEQEETKLVPLKLFVEILDDLKENTKYTHPCIKLARMQHKNSTELYFNLIRNAPNIHVASQIAEQYRHAYSETNFWEWSIDIMFTVVQRLSFVFADIDDRAFCLYGITNVYLLLTAIGGEQLHIKRISLIQPKDSSNNTLESYFDCPIIYGQDFDGFVLSSIDLYRINPKFNSKRYQSLLHQLSKHEDIFPKNQQFSTRVRNLITQTIGTGNYDIKTIAKIMGLHERTIQNRLAKEGLNYSNVFAELRMSLAKRLLIQERIPLTQIALMLGYGELSTFSRAFKKANHCSPRIWRNENHASPSTSE